MKAYSAGVCSMNAFGYQLMQGFAHAGTYKFGVCGLVVQVTMCGKNKHTQTPGVVHTTWFMVLGIGPT